MFTRSRVEIRGRGGCTVTSLKVQSRVDVFLTVKTYSFDEIGAG